MIVMITFHVPEKMKGKGEHKNRQRERDRGLGDLIMWTPADIEEETNPLSIIQKGVRLCEECDDDENVWVFFSYHERILPSTMTTATGNNQKKTERKHTDWWTERH